jgi:hypothetical protein
MNIHGLVSQSNFGLKMPTYISGNDIETFLHRFEHYCATQNVQDKRKANLLLSALDDVTFIVVNRELGEEEKKNYGVVKKHLAQRFDILKEKGQRRLILRQAKRKLNQTLAAFYTELLGLAEKAYPGENSHVIDEAIMDQFIYGCENDKIRLHLLDKSPKTSREALAKATSYEAAIRYIETITETATTKVETAAIASIAQPREDRGHGRGARDRWKIQPEANGQLYQNQNWLNNGPIAWNEYGNTNWDDANLHQNALMLVCCENCGAYGQSAGHTSNIAYE